jgi:hypothetical protein
MPLKDGEHTQILIQIASDIGETRASVDNVKKNVDVLSDDMRDLKVRMDKRVDRHECTERHIVVAKGIESLKKELVSEFKKVPTGQYYPAISAELIQEEIQKREEEQEKIANTMMDRRRKSILFWITVSSTLFALFGGLIVSMWKAFNYLNKINAAVITTNAELRNEIKTVGEQQKRVIVVRTSDLDARIGNDNKATTKKIKRVIEKR